MERIAAVETAKALMTEAVAWSVMKWLREKKTVRGAADRANAALDQVSLEVKDRWPDDVRDAYAALAKQSSETKQQLSERGNSASTIPQAIVSAKRVKKADEEAHRARIDAEETFDIAEKQLSTAMAREGCRKAIRSWELHERAIRKAEDLIRSR